MRRRLCWLGLGAALGIVVMRKVARLARGSTPAGLAGSPGSRLQGLTELVETVRTGMAAREIELREALTLDAEHREP
jgi:hypothetical protein